MLIREGDLFTPQLEGLVLARTIFSLLGNTEGWVSQNSTMGVNEKMNSFLFWFEIVPTACIV